MLCFESWSPTGHVKSPICLLKLFSHYLYRSLANLIYFFSFEGFEKEFSYACLLKRVRLLETWVAILKLKAFTKLKIHEANTRSEILRSKAVI